MGVVTQDAIDAAFAVIRKRGTVVVTGLNGPGVKNIQIPSFELTLFEKRIQGALFGGGNRSMTSPGCSSSTGPGTSSWTNLSPTRAGWTRSTRATGT